MQTVRAQAGFTLLELIIVMVIMSTIITLAIFPSVLAGMNAYSITASNVVALDKLRYASERMGYEIRELATASITSSPLPAIPIAAAPFSFTDSASVKTVSLYLKPASSSTQCDGSVILTYSAPVLTPAYLPVLTDSVCSLALAYYDATNTVTTVAASVRYVEVALAMNASASTSVNASNTYSMRTRIALRNR